MCECKLPYYHIKLTYQWLFQLFLTYYSIAPCTDSSIYLYSYPYILTICTLINFSPFPICIFSRQLACFIKCKFLISSRSIFSFILYYIILYCIIFYYFILNCIILYYVTLCQIISYYIILSYIKYYKGHIRLYKMNFINDFIRLYIFFYILFHLLFITFYIMLYYSIVYYIIVDYVILYHFKLCIIILYGLFKKKFINDFLRVLAQYVNIFRCLCVRLEH